MLCQKCGKNEAHFHYKQIINGEVAERHLCPECAGEEGLKGSFTQGPFVPDYNDYVSSMLQGIFGSPPASARTDGTTCPLCGASRGDIAKSGKVGCARCYDTFSDLLMPYVHRIHGAAEHRGKLPASAGAAIRLRRELERLRDDLRQAIENEEFEQAAMLRDRIREFKEASGNESA